MDGQPVRAEEMDGQPVREEEIDGQPVRAEEMDDQPVRAEEMDDQPVREEEMDSQPVRAEEILNEEAKKESKYKSVDVFKEVEPVIDVGNLYLNDLQPVDVKEVRSNNELFLKKLARDNVQLLFNKIWELPIERVDNVIVCNLPPVTTVLPREKKIPKPKPPTKWEIFAKQQGIQNKKRGRMIFDEESKTWKPRFGYKRGKDDTNEWCVEVPENADPNEDQFEKRNTAKKERVAKNELQRLHNIGRTNKGNNNDHKKAKEDVEKEIGLAKLSTASLGKFQEKLPKEKENKNKGVKRKFESVCGDKNAEKQKSLEIWGKMNNKKPSLDTTKAVNKHIANEQASFKEKQKSGKVKNKRFKKGAQATADRKRQKKVTLGKGKTLGKRRTIKNK